MSPAYPNVFTCCQRDAVSIDTGENDKLYLLFWCLETFGDWWDHFIVRLSRSLSVYSYVLAHFPICFQCQNRTFRHWFALTMVVFGTLTPDNYVADDFNTAVLAELFTATASILIIFLSVKLQHTTWLFCTVIHYHGIISVYATKFCESGPKSMTTFCFVLHHHAYVCI